MERTMIVGDDLADEVEGFGWGIWGVIHIYKSGNSYLVMKIK